MPDEQETAEAPVIREAEQTLPQAPQFDKSVFVLTQTLLQEVSFAPHFMQELFCNTYPSIHCEMTHALFSHEPDFHPSIFVQSFDALPHCVAEEALHFPSER